jgi:inward rectifier potassium channel
VKKGLGHWLGWLFGHLPLALGLTAVGVAVKQAIKLDLHDVPDPGVRWLLAGSLALVFVSIALIDASTERPNVQVNERVRIVSRWAAAGLLVLLGQVGDTMSGGTFLGLVTTLCVAQVVFDLMMAPLGLGTAEAAGAVSTARLAELRRQGVSPDRTVAPVGAAVRIGAPPELRRDLYFFFLEGSWGRVLASFAFFYLALNVLFAGLFMLDPEGIAGVGDNGRATFADAFFLSVQTLGTIGYGVLHPRTEWANFVVTVEAAVGMLFAALATGTMLAKATRPRSSVLWAEPLVITAHDGRPTLMLRVANARGNDVVDASMSLSALVDTVSAEGNHMRRVLDLKLVRDRQPMFALTWTVQHIIDAASPLHGLDVGPSGQLLAIVATMMGHDGTYGQTVYSRKIYQPSDLRLDHAYVDVMGQLPDGRLVIDLTKFHDTRPMPPSSLPLITASPPRPPPSG